MVFDPASQFTAEDILKIFPVGLNTGATAWIRLSGPRGKEVLMRELETAPREQDHARSGWFVAIGLLLSVNESSVSRTMSTKMRELLERVRNQLPDFYECVFGNGERINVIVSKGSERDGTYSVPCQLVTEDLIQWAGSPWP